VVRYSRWCSILMVVVATTSCGERAEPGQASVSVQRSDSAGIEIVQIAGEVEDLPTWTLSDEAVAEVRGDVEPFLGRVGEVALLRDGRILVADAQTAGLYRFGAREPAFDLLGSEGDGPGEFRAITTLSVTANDDAYAYDRRHRRLSEFSSEGDFLRSIPIDASATSDGVTPRRVWAFDSGRFALQGIGPLASEVETEGARRDQRAAVLLSLDSTEATVGERITFQGGYTIRAILQGRGIIIVAPFANVPIVSAGRERIVYGSGLSYELTVAHDDLTPERIIRWPGWVEPLTEEVLEPTRSEAHAQFAASFPDQADMMTEAMFTAELLPRTLPALGSALVDDSGRIWVARFQPTTRRARQRNAWHVLDPDGTPLARVVLPDRARLVAVRGDHVAVVVRDELDVEHLRVLTIEEAGSAKVAGSP